MCIRLFLISSSGASTVRNNTVRWNLSQNDGRTNSKAALMIYTPGANVEIEDSTYSQQQTFVYNMYPYQSLFMGILSTNRLLLVAYRRWFNFTIPVTRIFRFSTMFSSAPLALLFLSLSKLLQVCYIFFFVHLFMFYCLGLNFSHNSYWTAGGAFEIEWEQKPFSNFSMWQHYTNMEMTQNGKSVGIDTDPQMANIGEAKEITNVAELQSLQAYNLYASSPLIGAGISFNNFYLRMPF